MSSFTMELIFNRQICISAVSPRSWNLSVVKSHIIHSIFQSHCFIFSMKFISIRFMMLTMLPLIFILIFFAEIKDRGKNAQEICKQKLNFIRRRWLIYWIENEGEKATKKMQIQFKERERKNRDQRTNKKLPLSNCSTSITEVKERRKKISRSIKHVKESLGKLLPSIRCLFM